MVFDTMENKENETKENLLADKVPAASNNELQHQTNNQRFSSINLFDDKQLAVAENFLTKIMRSDKGGIKSVNDGLAILMRAQDLNLPFSTCIEHIHVINGKTGAIFYQNYSNGMMKTNLTQSDFKDLAKAINKQK